MIEILRGLVKYFLIFRQRLEEHETAIHNLKNDLETSRLESKNLLQQNAELHQALLTAREQLKQRFQQQQLQHEQQLQLQQQQQQSAAEQPNNTTEIKDNSIKGSVSGNSESEVSLNGEKGENENGDSSSYSIVDYESDQTSASEHARADSIGVDDINQTTVVIITDFFERISMHFRVNEP